MDGEVDERMTLFEIIEISHRLKLLQDILDGKRRNWKKEFEKVGGQDMPRYKAVGEAEAWDRSFTLPGSPVKWYWVDAEEEMP